MTTRYRMQQVLARTLPMSLLATSMYFPLANAAQAPAAANSSDTRAQSKTQQQDEGLEVITVTAQHRTESAQSVPVSINAFSGDELEAMGIERPSDIVSHIPNVDFFSFFGEAQNPSFCFRGICMNVQFSDSFEPPVAMYTDDVYVGSSFGQALQMFDVDRIEVLKGPQGTLYGRNTTGGLVNVITRKPSEFFEAQGSVDYGTHNDLITQGAVTGPLAEGVRGRLAIQRHTSDGYVHGYQDGDDANENDNLALRGILDFDIGDSSLLRISANYFNVDQGAQASSINGTLDPQTGDTCSVSQLKSGNCVGIYGTDHSANELYGGLSPKRWLGANIPGGYKPKNVVESNGVTATFTTKFGDMDFISITGYNRGRKDYIEDLDGEINFEYDDRLKAQTKTLSEEMRLSGTDAGIDWMTGVFLYHDEKDTQTALFPASLYYDDSTKKTDSWAVFGNVTFPLWRDDLSLTLGGRFTKEKRDLDFTRTGAYVSDAIGEKRSSDDSHFDWRAALQWQAAEKTMLYTSVTTSFRSANMNNQFQWGSVEKGSPLDSLHPVSPEYLTSYEVGLKTDFWDDRARLNAAMFYYDYEDMQYAIYVYDDELGLGGNRLRNIGDVGVWGGEVDLTLALTRDLRVGLGYGDTHSDIDSDATLDDGTPLDGHHLPMSNPTVNANIAYHISLGDYGDLRLGADYSWKDDHYFSITNSDTAYGESYGITNVHATWASVDGSYEVELHGDNIFDEEYYLYAGEIADNTQNIVWGKPAWWGLKVSYHY